MAQSGALLMVTAWRKLGLTVSLASALAVAGVLGTAGLAGVSEAREPVADGSLGLVTASDLPAEARQTVRLIHSGGPFPYGKDGSVFGNREALLPRQPRGHYREYTVPTPGTPEP